jgi:hypothetical protein
MKPDISSTFLIAFAPEHWGAVEFFSHFYYSTYKFEWQVRKRLSGIRGNFNKAHRLLRVIQDLAPRIDEDEQQLQTSGYTPAHRSKELAAVIEATLCSLYSTLDCFRHVFVAIYKNHRGVKDSTRGLFQKGHNGELDMRIPEPILEQFRLSKPWFDTLREYRDEITHSDVGSCHRDKDTGRILYMHSGLGTRGRSLVVDDVVAKIEEFRDCINSFLGKVFIEINRTLIDAESEEMCGIFGGRIYQRTVKPSEATDFHGGRCKSLEWFEKEEHPGCPLKEQCGAFARVKQTKTGLDG